MSVNYLARPWESRLFRQCRPAWDLGARERQDYEPVEQARVFDLGEALHDALDVYYFPGMWDWNRAIVRPLAVAGLEKSMRRQRDAYAHTREPPTACMKCSSFTNADATSGRTNIWGKANLSMWLTAPWMSSCLTTAAVSRQ